MVQSSPLIFQYAISIISWEFFFILIERNGLHEDDLAISNTMRNIFGLFGVSTWAFAATSSTMVSNIIGQKRHSEVPQLIWKIMSISSGIAIVVCILLNIFDREVLSLFSNDEIFIERSLPVLRVVSVALILMSFATVWLNSVIGTGNTKVNLAIEFFTIILYSVYVYVVLEQLKLGIVWGWASELIYWTSIFILSFLYIRSGKWKAKVI